MYSDNDLHYMLHAMDLAKRGEGKVNPNPLVGAVIVGIGADGGSSVIAEGWHHRYGALHAERDALSMADREGRTCRGATMYVNLEPCCHTGHQPPCTDAIISHGIARVVVGLVDPNPLVAGKGIARLREAGIEVDVAEEDPKGKTLVGRMRHQNRVFLNYISRHQPWIAMKYAMTLDGKICTSTGDSKWVSSSGSLEYLHLLRRKYMAIMCGIGTVLADNPMLTTRIPEDPEARNPIRIIVDRRLRTPLDSNLVQTARSVRTVVAYAKGADEERRRALADRGVETWQCDSIADLMRRMGDEGIDGVLLEGGGILNEAFLSGGFVSEIYAVIAPKLIGGADAKTPVEGSGIKAMADAIRLTDVTCRTVGEDILIRGLCSQV